MERRRLIAGNWKMNLTVAGAVSLAETVISAAAKNPQVDVAVFPTFVSLLPVYEKLRGTAVALGAQDVFWKVSGAFTGEISPTMLVDVRSEERRVGKECRSGWSRCD